MKDKRGVDRGKCTIQGCLCGEYQLQLSDSQACGVCNHPPTKHESKGGPPLSGGIRDGRQSQLSQHGEEETSSFMSLQPVMKSLSAIMYGAFASSSSREEDRSLEYASNPVVAPQSLLQAPVQAVVDPTMRCKYPGCPKAKYVEDGRVHDFCGKTHADMFNGQVAQQVDMHSPQNICKLPGCTRAAFPGHDCCGHTHGRAYKRQQEQAGVPCSQTLTAGPGSVVSQREICKNPQCGRRRICLDGNILEDFCGKSCSQAAQGVDTCCIWLIAPGSKEHSTVTSQFMSSWTKKSPPSQSCFKAVFSIDSVRIEKRYSEYKRRLQGNPNEQKLFHGAPLKCNITATQALCSSSSCAVCGVSRVGFKSSKIATHVQFQRIGRAFYFAPNSSKCHEYTEGTNGCRALLLCDVAQGQMYMATSDMTSLTSPPSGYDSVSASPTRHSGMNYPEVAVYREEAVMPRYIIVYQHDGERLLL